MPQDNSQDGQQPPRPATDAPGIVPFSYESRVSTGESGNKSGGGLGLVGRILRTIIITVLVLCTLVFFVCLVMVGGR